MWQVSQRFTEAARISQNSDAYVELFVDGVKQTMADGSTKIYPQDGSTTLDEGSNVRAQTTFSFADKYLVPMQASELLDPVVTDIKPWLGLAFTEGFTEWVPMGVFRVNKAGVSKVDDVISVTADDYSRVLTDDRFLTPWATPAGTLVTDEIKRIALDSLPTLTVFNLSGSTRRTTAASWEKDRWEAIENLAASISAEVFFDRLGQLIIRPVPQITSSSTAVWEANTDSDDAVIVDYEAAFSSEGIYNAVYVSSSAPDTNISAVVYQTTGKYRWRQGFKRPRFYSSPMLTTYDQCVNAGTAILARSLTAARTLNPTVIPNWALDVGDIINVTLPANPKTGVQYTEKRVISKIVVPWKYGLMDLSTRVVLDIADTNDAGSLS